MSSVNIFDRLDNSLIAEHLSPEIMDFLSVNAPTWLRKLTETKVKDMSKMDVPINFHGTEINLNDPSKCIVGECYDWKEKPNLIVNEQEMSGLFLWYGCDNCSSHGQRIWKSCQDSVKALEYCLFEFMNHYNEVHKN